MKCARVSNVYKHVLKVLIVYVTGARRDSFEDEFDDDIGFSIGMPNFFTGT